MLSGIRAPLYALPETAAVALGWWLLRRQPFDPGLICCGVRLAGHSLPDGVSGQWTRGGLAIWLSNTTNMLP